MIQLISTKFSKISYNLNKTVKPFFKLNHGNVLIVSRVSNLLIKGDICQKYILLQSKKWINFL